MPCSDGSGPYPIVEIRSDTKKIRRLESMLCSACRVLEESKFDFDKNPRLSEWWDTHKRADAEREKRVARLELRKQLAKELSKKPINELTAQDKKVLRAEGYL